MFKVTPPPLKRPLHGHFVWKNRDPQHSPSEWQSANVDTNISSILISFEAHCSVDTDSSVVGGGRRRDKATNRVTQCFDFE